MTWPVEHGGGGRTALERFVVTETLIEKGAPIAASWFADRQMGPTLIAFGTDDQKQRFLPGILAGETGWCIGMSEPNSGSDLASLTTKAERDGDTFVINGQKIWTSFGDTADYCYLICRTSNEGPPHAGISEIIVPLDSPGITIRPIEDMTTNRHFCEVWYEDVRVPVENLVGTENGSWKQTMRQLEHERGGIDRLLSNHALYLEAKAAGRPVRSRSSARTWPASRPATGSDGSSCCERRSARRPARSRRRPRASAPSTSSGSPTSWPARSDAEAMLWGRVARGACYAPAYTIMGGHGERAAQHHRRARPRVAEGTGLTPVAPRSVPCRRGRQAVRTRRPQARATTPSPTRPTPATTSGPVAEPVSGRRGSAVVGTPVLAGWARTTRRAPGRLGAVAGRPADRAGSGADDGTRGTSDGSDDEGGMTVHGDGSPAVRSPGSVVTDDRLAPTVPSSGSVAVERRWPTRRAPRHAAPMAAGRRASVTRAATTTPVASGAAETGRGPVRGTGEDRLDQCASAGALSCLRSCLTLRGRSPTAPLSAVPMTALCPQCDAERGQALEGQRPIFPAERRRVCHAPWPNDLTTERGMGRVAQPARAPRSVRGRRCDDG